jgi:hypothetical protein
LIRFDGKFRQNFVALLDDSKETVRLRTAAAHIGRQRVSAKPPKRHGATTQ